MKNIFDVLVCPVCGSPLIRSGGSLVCENINKSHTFDIASSGYVNLLPPGKKKNSHTGDNRDMVRSRLDFLSTGLYDKISDSVAELILKYASFDDELVLLDSGCGEGYHTCRICENLSQNVSSHILCAAFDASKHAVEKGAKKAEKNGFDSLIITNNDARKNTGVYFFAGNIFSLPVSSNIANVVLSMFAPIDYQGLERLLGDNGIFVVAASGQNHLIEMRNILYDNVRSEPAKIKVPSGFTLCAHETVRYSIDLETNEMISNLFKMTPFFYKSSFESKERLLSEDSLRVTVETENFVLKKDR